MKPDINISDRDVQRVLKNLDKYSVKVQQKIDLQVYRSAQNINGNAVRNCPVKTSRLKNSLHVKTSKDRAHNYSDNEGKGFNGTLSVGVQKGQAVVGTNVEYAQDVEFGEVKTKTGSQPFLRPAANKEKQRFNNAIRKILRERPN